MLLPGLFFGVSVYIRLYESLNVSSIMSRHALVGDSSRGTFLVFFSPKTGYGYINISSDLLRGVADYLFRL